MKKVVYWLTVIPALIDAIKGAISGIQKGLADIEAAKVAAKEQQNRQAFDEANRGGSDLDEK